MTTRRKDRKPKLKFGDKVTVIASDCRWKGRHEVVTGFEGNLILCRDSDDDGHEYYEKDLKIGWEANPVVRKGKGAHK